MRRTDKDVILRGIVSTAGCQIGLSYRAIEKETTLASISTALTVGACFAGLSVPILSVIYGSRLQSWVYWTLWLLFIFVMLIDALTGHVPQIPVPTGYRRI